MSERGEELLSRGEGEGEITCHLRTSRMPTPSLLSDLQRDSGRRQKGGRKSRQIRRAREEETREEAAKRNRRNDAARWSKRPRRRRQGRRRGGLKRRERRWRDASCRRRRPTPPSWTTTGRGSEYADQDPDDLRKGTMNPTRRKRRSVTSTNVAHSSLDDPKMRTSSS